MSIVVSRYARAFADVVAGQKMEPARAREELASMVEVLAAAPHLRRVWETPSIPAEQKRRLLDEVVKRTGASRWTRNFLAVLVDRRRIGLLPQIARQFEREMDSRLGLAEAHITSSRELDAAGKQRLEKEVEKLTGKKVRALYDCDPALLGGAVVRIGSTIYDGSVRGQLTRLKQQLSSVS
jgi:F-type H+-transporting ATPase subunit delta